MDFSKTTEPAPSAQPDVLLAQLAQLATPVLILEETSPTTAHVLQDFTMPVLINVPLAAQAVLLAQALLPVPVVTPQSSELLTTLFVSVKRDTSN